MRNIFNYMYMYFMKLDHKTITTISQNDNLHFIGIFDESTNMWYNAWALYTYNKEYRYYKKSRDLLKYSINMDIDTNNIDHINIILRSILINSKTYITEKDIQIDIILSIITYLLKAKSYSIIKKHNLNYYVVEID